MRMQRLCLAAVLAVPLTHSGTSASAAESAEAGGPATRPNVLLIVSEDTGPHLGCYGDQYVRTPHLDRLADEGVRFNRVFVATASCSESRSTILTGLYPHQNGQIGLATHRYFMYPDVVPLPNLLAKRGYRSGIIGKLHVNPPSAFAFDFRWHRHCRDVRKIAEVAGEFMKADDKPFFLMVNYADAHVPYVRQQDGFPEKPLDGEDVATWTYAGMDTPETRAAVANYYNCVSRLDTGVGMLLERLNASGMARRTLVIYLGDHGPQPCRAKVTCYEAGLHVPLIMRFPGKIRPGLVKDDLVATVDLAPTILSAAGATVPANLPGRSLWPLIQGDSPPWREYLFAEYHSHYPPLYFPQRCVRDGRYKLIVNLMQDRPNPLAERTWRAGPTYIATRKKGLLDILTTAPEEVRRAYSTFRDAPPEELYDLESDPYEFNNLVGKPQYAAIQARLRKALQTWQQRTDDPLTDPQRLAKLTAEHDAMLKFYDSKSNKYPPWKYHDYMRSGEHTPLPLPPE